MRSLLPVGILRMLYEHSPAHLVVRLAHILCHMASQCKCKRLYATAYSEHRHLTVECQACEKQLGRIAHGIDAM